MSDLREYVKDRLARYPGVTCALHHDLRHWLMEHPERDAANAALDRVRALIPVRDLVLAAEISPGIWGVQYARLVTDLTAALSEPTEGDVDRG